MGFKEVETEYKFTYSPESWRSFKIGSFPIRLHIRSTSGPVLSFIGSCKLELSEEL